MKCYDVFGDFRRVMENECHLFCDVRSGRWCFLGEFYLKRHILYLVVACSLGEQLMPNCIKQTDHGSHNSLVSFVFTVSAWKPILFGPEIADNEENQNEGIGCISDWPIVLRREAFLTPPLLPFPNGLLIRLFVDFPLLF